LPGLAPSPKAEAPIHRIRCSGHPGFDEAVEMAVVSLPRIPEEEALAKTREA
jgi:hypothetical protein